jgi:hypothetical protein
MQRNEKQTISLALNSRIIIGIVLLLLLVHIGFYKTYIRHFPGFEDYITPNGRKFHFSWVKHFHGMMMMGWVLMLLLQPILILKGKIKWHHRVGRLCIGSARIVISVAHNAGAFLWYFGTTGIHCCYRPLIPKLS